MEDLFDKFCAIILCGLSFGGAFWAISNYVSKSEVEIPSVAEICGGLLIVVVLLIIINKKR